MYVHWSILRSTQNLHNFHVVLYILKDRRSFIINSSLYICKKVLKTLTEIKSFIKAFSAWKNIGLNKFEYTASQFSRLFVAFVYHYCMKMIFYYLIILIKYTISTTGNTELYNTSFSVKILFVF